LLQNHNHGTCTFRTLREEELSEKVIMKNPLAVQLNLHRIGLVKFALALILGVLAFGQAHAANLIANPGFENNPPPTMANNIGWSVLPWILGGGSSSNVVKVDGPGGYDYFSNGPESDGSAPGAGVPQHYLDIANGGNDLYQSFTVPTCPASPTGTSATVTFSGKFSTRAINIGYPSGPAANGKVQILSGTGTSGSVIASQTAAMTAGPSKTTPWVVVSGIATVARGATFSYVVRMDDNVNFDDAVVTIDADPCNKSVTLIKGFTKSVKRDCDKITYTIRVYTLSDGGSPDTVTVSDNWPPGLNPASAVSFTSTPNVTGTPTLTSTGWSIHFPTPTGTAGTPIVGSYTISFTTTLNPSSLNAGDFKLTNQAALTVQSLPGQTLKSDDPTTPAQGDATTINIPVAEVKKCLGLSDSGGQTPNCLSGKAEVTCGPTPGTYTITLHPQGVNGVVPSVLQVSTSTPGISLVPANASILVVGGVAHVTVVGANPGQAITLEVAGSATGQGSSAGLDQCCNGKVEIVIPKDLDCDKPIVKVEKICDPAVLKPGPTDVPVYEAHCKIRVTSTGPITTPIHLTETPPAGATITAITPPAPWVCAPSVPPATTSPVGCDISAAAFNALPGHVSTLDVVMSFSSNEGHPVNCATIDTAVPHSTRPWDEQHPNKSCSPINFPPKVKVEKTCETAVKGKNGYVAHCKITVTADGPATAPISFSELLSGAGKITAMTSNPAATVCTPSPAVNANTPINCSVPAGPFNANANSATIDVTVQFANAGQADEAKNCARLVDGLKHAPSCDDFHVKEGKIDIKKICEPAVEVVGAINHYEAKCHITVTTTGPQSGVITVNDGFTGVGTMGPATATAPWTCAGSGCTVNGAALNQTSSTSIIDVVVSFTNPGNVAEAKNCATVSSPSLPQGKQSCTGFTVDVQQPSTLKINKVCDPATEVVGAINHFEAKCHITVTSTGPQNGTIVVNEAMTGGTVISASAPAPWNCTTANCNVNGSALNQMSSTTVIEIVAQVAANEKTARNCAVLSRTNANPVESCADIAINSKSAPELAIVKTGPTDCKPSIPCAFTISITSVGKPYNGNVLLYDILSPNLAWPITAITPNVCGTSISTMPFGCVANLNLAADTPLTFTVTLNPLNLNNSIGTDENCITAAFVGPNVPTGPITGPEIQALGLSQMTSPQQACWPFDFTTGKETTGYISITKQALFNGNHITSQTFTGTLTCDGIATPFSFKDGKKYGQSAIPIGAVCTVVEDPSVPAAGLCPAGQDASWFTTYNPQVLPPIKALGVYVTVTNDLRCTAHTIVVPPKCDPATATPAGDLCRCRFDHMSPVSKTACQCQQGYKLEAGRGCVKMIERPSCKPPQIYNSATNSCITPRPVCNRPQIYNPATNSCITPRPICRDPQIYNPATNSCITPRPVCNLPRVYNKATNSCITPRPVCQPPQVYNPKRNRCESVRQECPRGTLNVRGQCIDIPRCRFPQIPVPGTGMCIDIGRPKPRDKGPIDGQGGGLPIPGLKIPGL
jgi:hypothetical protein